MTSAADNQPAAADYSDAITAFGDACRWTWIVCEQFKRLYHRGGVRTELLNSHASLFFQDLHRVLLHYFLLQVCKLTDPAGAGERQNLTVAYFLTDKRIPASARRKLEALEAKMQSFRSYVVGARNKIISHADLRASLSEESMGAFPVDAEEEFFCHLQDFVNILSQHYHGDDLFIIDIVMPTDAEALVLALRKATVFDELVRESRSDMLERLSASVFHDA